MVAVWIFMGSACADPAAAEQCPSSPPEAFEACAKALLEADLEDWAALQRTASALRARELGSEGFRTQLGETEANAAFRMVQALDASDPGKVGEAWLAYTTRYPDHGPTGLAWLNAAAFLQRAGRAAEAVTPLRNALAKGLDPPQAEAARTQLARLLVFVGDVPAAAAEYEVLAAGNGDEANDALLDAARLRDRLGETEAAIRLYEQWCLRAPQDPGRSDVQRRLTELSTR